MAKTKKTFEKIAIFNEGTLTLCSSFVTGSLQKTSSEISGFKPLELFYERVSIFKYNRAYGCMVVYSTAYSRDENIKSIVAYLIMTKSIETPYSDFVIYHKNDLKYLLGMDPEDIATTLTKVYRHMTYKQLNEVSMVYKHLFGIYRIVTRNIERAYKKELEAKRIIDDFYDRYKDDELESDE